MVKSPLSLSISESTTSSLSQSPKIDINYNNQTLNSNLLNNTFSIASLITNEITKNSVMFGSNLSINSLSSNSSTSSFNFHFF
jgi:hypothetical protein